MEKKVAVVNGGAGGIGRAVVRRLGEAGYALFILDKNEQAGGETLEELRQQDNRIAAFPALIAWEKGSRWYKAQIVLPLSCTKEQAVELKDYLRTIFTDKPCLGLPGRVEQNPEKFPYAGGEKYIWK